MPYTTKKNGDQVCVYKKDEDGNAVGESLGCHDSPADAREQIKALYAQEGTRFLESESLEEKVSTIRRAAWENFNKPNGADVWVRDVLEDAIIIQFDEDMWKVPYTMDDDGVTFAAREKWEKVQLKYVTVSESEYIGHAVQEDDVITIFRTSQPLGPYGDVLERDLIAR